MTDLVHVKGLSDLQKLLDELPVKLEKNVMRGALRAGMNIVKPEAQQNIHSVSGELARGLKVSTNAKRGVVTAKLKATGPHAFIAHMLEFTGASAHTIMPSVKKALAIGGASVASVEHPGFRPKPFMRPALDARAGDAVVTVGNYVKQRLATKSGLDKADITVEETPE